MLKGNILTSRVDLITIVERFENIEKPKSRYPYVDKQYRREGGSLSKKHKFVYKNSNQLAFSRPSDNRLAKSSYEKRDLTYYSYSKKSYYSNECRSRS